MEQHHYRLLISSMTSLVLLVFFCIVTWGIISPGFFHTIISVCDSSVQQGVLLYAPGWLVALMSFVTLFADPRVIILIQAIVFVLCLIEQEDTLGGFFIGTMLTGEIFSFALKDLLLRARPGFIPGTLESTTYAYPSSHALISILFYGLLCYIILHAFENKIFKSELKNAFWKHILLTATVFLIFIIGISRIILNVHWLSDVIGGWLLGGAMLAALIAAGEWVILWHRDTHKWRHALIVCVGIVFLCTSIIATLFIS